MTDTGQTLGSLYGPDAGDAPLLVQRPVQSWIGSRSVFLVAVNAFVVILVYWIVRIFTSFPDTLVPRELTGGYSLATVMVVVSCLWLLAAMVAGAVLQRQRDDICLVPWTDWAQARGFTSIEDPAPSLVGEDQQLIRGHSHAWTPALRGRAGGCTAIIGNVRWKVGDEGDEHDDELLFVRIVMSEQAGRVHPGTCVLSRFMLVPRDIRHDLAYELRFESIGLDDSCEVWVDARPNDIVWRQLFDLEMIELMTLGFEVSWRQHGRDLVLVADQEPDMAPARLLDTMCAAGAAIASHMDELGRRLELARSVDPSAAVSWT
jgi:hypothetical protein